MNKTAKIFGIVILLSLAVLMSSSLVNSQVVACKEQGSTCMNLEASQMGTGRTPSNVHINYLCECKYDAMTQYISGKCVEKDKCPPPQSDSEDSGSSSSDSSSSSSSSSGSTSQATYDEDLDRYNKDDLDKKKKDPRDGKMCWNQGEKYCDSYNTYCNCVFKAWYYVNGLWQCNIPCGNGFVCYDTWGDNRYFTSDGEKICKRGVIGCTRDEDCPGQVCRNGVCMDEESVQVNTPSGSYLPGDSCETLGETKCGSGENQPNIECECKKPEEYKTHSEEYYWDCKPCDTGMTCSQTENICVQSAQTITPSADGDGGETSTTTGEPVQKIKGTMDADEISSSNKLFKRYKVTIDCPKDNCKDMDGKLMFSNGDEKPVPIRSAAEEEINLKRPDFGEGPRTVTLSFEDEKYDISTTSVTVEENNICSPQEYFGPGFTCKCGGPGGSAYGKGSCCFGQHEKDANTREECTTPKPEDPDSKSAKLSNCNLHSRDGMAISEDCLCHGKTKVIYDETKNQYCCAYDDGKVVTDLSQCSNKKCKPDCSALNSVSSDDDKCDCPDYCNYKGLITEKSDDKTCQGHNEKAFCDTQGECLTEEKCAEGKSEGTYAGEVEGFPCYDPADVCCQVAGDGEKTTLSYCDTECLDIDGCICPANCDAETIGRAFTCSGKLREEVTEQDSCVPDKKDGYCPPGCFWFNDRDCGVDKNLGNVLWDVMPKDWKEAYDEHWADIWVKIGAHADLMYWAESVCNPTSRNYELRKAKETGFIASYGDMAGWLGAKKDPYNTTAWVYTVSWYLSGLREDNRYTITLEGREDTWTSPENGSINITAGQTHSGENASLVLISGYDYDQACISFDEKVEHKYSLESKKIDKICRNV